MEPEAIDALIGWFGPDASFKFRCLGAANYQVEDQTGNVIGQGGVAGLSANIIRKLGGGGSSSAQARRVTAPGAEHMKMAGIALNRDRDSKAARLHKPPHTPPPPPQRVPAVIEPHSLAMTLAMAGNADDDEDGDDDEDILNSEESQ